MMGIFTASKPRLFESNWTIHLFLYVNFLGSELGKNLQGQEEKGWKKNRKRGKKKKAAANVTHMRHQEGKKAALWANACFGEYFMFEHSNYR